MPQISPEFKISNTPVPYEEALAFQEQRVADIIAGKAGPCVWFLEHPPLYTSGTSAKADGLVDPERFPVYNAGRGGEYTYHGPGQLVVYVMIDLKQLFAPAPPDLKAYITRLESWIINALAEYGVRGFLKEGMIGVWVDDAGQHKKIAAIGVRVKKWVAFHGLCINVAPDLTHYQGIVPCGIRGFGVTSLEQLGRQVTMEELRKVMQKNAHQLLVEKKRGQ